MPFPYQLNSFFAKQFDYFKDNDYYLYFEGKDIGGSLYKSDLGIVHNSNIEKTKDELLKTNFRAYTISSAEQYIKELNKSDKNAWKNWIVKSKDNTKPTWESIKFIYGNYPEEQKTILTFLNGLSHTPFTEVFEEFFDLFSKTKKEFLSLIKSFPKSTLSVHTIELKTLDNYLYKRNFTFEETDHFFFNYLKQRESKLNLPVNFPLARDFLLEKYEGKESLLEKYFSFFPALKNEFTDLKYTTNDIFIPLALYSTIVDIDLTQCMKKILTDKWDIVNYRKAVGDIRRAIANYFNVENHYSKEHDGIKNVERLTFIHNNEKLTQSSVQEIVLEYLLYMKNDPQMQVDSNTNYAWLSHYLLTKKINEYDINNQKTTNKKKI